MKDNTKKNFNQRNNYHQNDEDLPEEWKVSPIKAYKAKIEDTVQKFANGEFGEVPEDLSVAIEEHARTVNPNTDNEGVSVVTLFVQRGDEEDPENMVSDRIVIVMLTPFDSRVVKMQNTFVNVIVLNGEDAPSPLFYRMRAERSEDFTNKYLPKMLQSTLSKVNKRVAKMTK